MTRGHQNSGISRRTFLAGGGAVAAGAALASLPLALPGCAPATGSQAGSKTALREGTFEASAPGRNGDVKVQVVIADQALTEVSVIAHHETEVIAGSALTHIPRAIVDGQTLQVDAISGATFTSNAILVAAGACIEQAGGVADDFSRTDPAPSSRNLSAGTYHATAHGHHSDVEVEVVVGPESINSVTLLSSGETYNLSAKACETIPAAIVEAQTTGIDTVSGATYTSRAIQTAVEQCLEQAGGIEAVRGFGARVSSEAQPPSDETVAVDVVVVGSGMAGIAAALSAQENGAQVAIVEKLPYWGGVSQTVRGYFAIATDDSEKAINDYYEYGLHMHCGIMQDETEDAHYPDKDLSYTLAAESWRAAKWLESKGVELIWSEKPYIYANQPEYYRMDAHFVAGDVTDAPDVVGLNFQILIDQFEQQGGKIYLDTSLTELLTDSSGQVVGIKTQGRGGSYTFNAKAVILCAGGFGASQTMVEKYAPAYVGEENVTLVGNTGDGIRLAEDIGAAVYDSGFLFGQCGHTLVDDYTMIHPYEDHLTPQTCIYVNSQGLRMNSEDPIKYTPGSNYVYPAEKDFYWALCNREVAAQTEYLALLEEQLEAGNERFFTADTLAELARTISITPNTLRYTLNRYNRFCENGVDEDYAKKPESLIAMDTQSGPWYAVKCYMKYFGTGGGLKTTTSGAVIDAQGAVIPGLYAAGENANHGFFNLSYTGARSMTICLVMGMLSGAAAAKDSA